MKIPLDRGWYVHKSSRPCAEGLGGDRVCELELVLPGVRAVTVGPFLNRGRLMRLNYGFPLVLI